MLYFRHSREKGNPVFLSLVIRLDYRLRGNDEFFYESIKIKLSTRY